MASSKMYAWSNLHAGDKVVKVGDEADQKALGIEDEEWAALVETGAVRAQKYPDVAEGESPTEYYKRMVAEAEAGNFAEFVAAQQADAEEVKAKEEGK